MFLYLLPAIILFIDQYSKYWIKSNMTIGETIIIIPNVLSLQYIDNPGIAFGYGTGNYSMVILFFTFIAILFIIYLFIISNKNKTFDKYPLALILGGAMGNLLDRLYTILKYDDYYGVVDFIKVGINANIQYPWIFNFADTSISIGFILLLISEYFKYRKQKNA